MNKMSKILGFAVAAAISLSTSVSVSATEVINSQKNCTYNCNNKVNLSCIKSLCSNNNCLNKYYFCTNPSYLNNLKSGCTSNLSVATPSISKSKGNKVNTTTKQCIKESVNNCKTNTCNSNNAEIKPNITTNNNYTPDNSKTKNDNNLSKPNDKNNTLEDSKYNNGNKNLNTNNSENNTSGNFSNYQTEVLNLVNSERSKAGLKPLKANFDLNKLSTLKSEDMMNNNYFSHNSPTYGSAFDMMNKFNISYNTAGENIAMGQPSPSEVMNSWMNSSGHRANILNPNFTDLGVGIAKDSNGRLYWTQMFLGK